MYDTDTKNMFPVHIILGASDFAKTKMGTCPRVGRLLNRLLGWIVMSPGRENDIVSALFTKSSVNDYQKLCGTDVL